MRAGAFLGDGKVGLIDVDEPAPPGPGEVQIDVAWSGVCGSDLHVVEHGVLPPGSVLGHEFSGTVRATGPGTRMPVGTRAAVVPFTACGRCRYCEEGSHLYCDAAEGYGLGHRPGGLAPRLNVPERNLHVLPDSVGLEHGALVEPLAVGYHAVRDSGIRAGQSAVVMGAGPIGIAVLLAAKALGAFPLIVTERSEARAALAERFGADEVLLSGADDVVSGVMRRTGIGVDVVFECVGVPGTLAEAVTLGRKGSRVQYVGVCMEPDTVLPVMLSMREAVIRFTWCYSTQDFADTVGLVERSLASDRLVEAMITRREPVSRMDAVFAELRRSPRDVKILFETRALG